jgi:hypothetical protein
MNLIYMIYLKYIDENYMINQSYRKLIEEYIQKKETFTNFLI